MPRLLRRRPPLRNDRHQLKGRPMILALIALAAAALFYLST
jgi:hypothetical protein